MSWLDRAIAFLSPKAAVNRASWQSALTELRSYDAGTWRNANSRWSVVNASGEVTDRYERDIVRARARDLERNSDIMNALISVWVRNVVGRGFVLQAETDSEDLNAQIESLWRTWCQAKNCDVTHTQSLTQILRMAVRRKKIDGGILIVKRYTDSGILPLALQLFEVDELDGVATATHDSKNRTVGGIEYNAYNAPVGYWIRQYDYDGMTAIEPVFIPAEDVIFYRSKRRPSQLREVSDMAQTITRIRDANEFVTAVSMKQRIEACFSVFIKKALPNQVGRGATASSDRYEGKTLTPGMIMELGAGDDATAINPQGQSTDAASFLKLLQRMVGAGQGISYEATTRDMSQSTYSSARQGLIEDALAIAEEEELLLDALNDIYEAFIAAAFLENRLSDARYWTDPQSFCAHRFSHPPRGWIDPLKEAQAQQIALATGQKTYKEIAASNGSDWRQQIDDISEVLAYARARDVDLGGVLFGQPTQQAKQPQPAGQQTGQQPPNNR